MSQIEIAMPREFENCKDLRLYWHNGYKRWTVDVIPMNPSKVERKTFRSKTKAEIFAREKKNELVSSET